VAPPRLSINAGSRVALEAVVRLSQRINRRYVLHQACEFELLFLQPSLTHSSQAPTADGPALFRDFVGTLPSDFPCSFIIDLQLLASRAIRARRVHAKCLRHTPHFRVWIASADLQKSVVLFPK